LVGTSSGKGDKKVHDELVQPPFRSATSILAYKKLYDGRIKAQAKKVEGWKKLMEGMLKINVDAAFDVISGRGAAGVIIRDCRGQCIAASQRFLPHVVDVKLMLSREGLILAQQVGINNFIVQTDWWLRQCKMEVPLPHQLPLSILVVKLFGAVLIGFRLSNRKANQVAHELAMVSFDSSNSCN
jgi:hypothetical protein